MRLLCLDIGAGTQDVLLLDTSQPLENAIQLIIPAPTVLVARQIELATKRREDIILVGETMGGGACTSALKKHLEAGLKVYATPEAARTFSDDLEEVASWGVRLVSPDEAARLIPGTKIRMGDISLDILERSLSCWGLELCPDAVAVAVLDHGAAPPGESDRLFRFRHLERLLQKNSTLEGLIFIPESLPAYLTRMQAVVRSLYGRFPLLLMDTGPAAVLGAMLDRTVAAHRHLLAVNLGNSHTIAFHLEGLTVLGFFEHHTSLLSLSRLEELLKELVAGELEFRKVWSEGGHGSLILERSHKMPFITATGPRRQMFASSQLRPYFSAPFGSMMLTGCFGLARAVALKFPQWREEIEKSLFRG